MCNQGLVYAVATEDMDALTFGAPRLLRSLISATLNKPGRGSDQKSNSKSIEQQIITEVDLATTLKELDLTQEEFIQLCILMGCDYCPTIKGLGPASAYKLIKQHHNIDNALKEIEKSGKYKVSDDFSYSQAAEIFNKPAVLDSQEIKLDWRNPDEEGLIDFLVRQKGFSEDRVKAGIERMRKSKSKQSQQRMDSFFQIQPSNKQLADTSKERQKGKKNLLTGSKAKEPTTKKLKV